MNALLSDAFNESRSPVHRNPTLLPEAAERLPIWRTDAGRAAERIVGESLGWRNVLKRATPGAATETTVCLHGESGTGKEVVARYLHGLSPRRLRHS
jgi:transcriptional regulator with GAF, ATPase, and Fis domain